MLALTDMIRLLGRFRPGRTYADQSAQARASADRAVCRIEAKREEHAGRKNFAPARLLWQSFKSFSFSGPANRAPRDARSLASVVDTGAAAARRIAEDHRLIGRLRRSRCDHKVSKALMIAAQPRPNDKKSVCAREARLSTRKVAGNRALDDLPARREASAPALGGAARWTAERKALTKA
jgi:hypothetical protein